ncbi:MAG: hypothetical protein JSV90_07820 [Methanobacteriota archaeon]|nr:MAG: hypothetical protein JSV90_07820 [Euryarchaeota archaeon]
MPKWHIGLALAAMMIIPSLMIASPALMGTKDVPQNEFSAEIEVLGDREVTYTVANMFELYLKSTDYSHRGNVTATMGINEWWDTRTAYPYPDLFIRRSYPFTMLYDYYSDELSNIPGLAQMGYGVYTFYRNTMEASNISGLGTGVGKDPHFIPMLNPGGLTLDGGSVSWNWQVTYLLAQELTDITAGNHYANTYYGVPAGAVTFTGGDANDGWWTEIHGTMTFNRSAAVKFLNLAGTGDLRTEFNTANSGGALNTAWASHWSVDGTGAGKYDIYNAYDWPIDSGTIDAWLSVDGSSTADSLVLRIWGHAWGYEMLMMRYLETVGLIEYLQSYAEDIYLNGTCGSEGGDLDGRFTSFYRMMAWKDPDIWSAAWNLDSWHIDGCPNNLAHPASSWNSRYDNYDYEKSPSTYNPMTREWTPGTIQYGQMVRYWQPPEGHDIPDGEKLVIELGSDPTIGYQPYVGTSDVIDAAKAAELTSHAYWGELVLGSCYPSTISDYYDATTKTITMEGPIDLPDAQPNEDVSYPLCNSTGSPQFVFAVSNVSYYDVEMLDAGPYSPGVPYSIRVTAKNLTDVTVTGWNGTVMLSSNNPGTTFGTSSHTFVPSTDAGVWQTTVTFGSPSSNTYINATDTWFPLDVTGGLTPGDIGTVIPEFSMILLPVIGIAVIVVFVKRRRQRRNDGE